MAGIPDLYSFPETGKPIHSKLEGYDFYRSIGSPRHIVAPMVDQSELAWRILSRRYGSDLVYSPMINAKIYVQQNRGAHRVREGFFNQEQGEEGAHSIQLGGNKDTDRPLIVQFCANDPDMLLDAAKYVEDRCDAVDLNLGCPQQIAKRGNFGAFLMDDWDLVFKLIHTLHVNLKVPVTAKFRVYDSLEKTLAYAKMIRRAGAQLVTVHGRTREMKGHKTGLADWSKIRAVKEALDIPVFANGNMLYPEDWRDCLAYTGCDGVMSAEGNLYNPTLYHPSVGRDLSVLSQQDADHAAYAPLEIVRVAQEYLDIVATLKTPTSPSALKGHMFKITRPALAIHTDLRPELGKARSPEGAQGEERVKEYREFLQELEKRLAEDRKEAKYYQKREDVAHYYQTPQHLQDPSDRRSRPDFVPHWYLQPYFRPPLNPPKPKEEAAAEDTKPAHHTPTPSSEDRSAKRTKTA
ncbi:tRNA-dihydrouridine(16/17) synthase [NAD(P)(+)] [Malassezia equina]|uniref:tRNA-dihydrouridine(16/17) synthase [NAD(P)(+)] n=1 Tax=Malassezia equina TaxID=1381935 RepID=A0AAF0J060_9BASI|nr:tRNA-dihydrouridine(16/17) synthase [NAD(P)(+)] [Malassezia equina]